ncbi:MAG TPA: methyltransferase [Oxalobacteraceae bacterium]|nr:methyltransferase [Oxalobacteraceae bacterium]
MDGWWQEVFGVIRGEFSDLPNIAEFTRVCVRLFMAIILGGILGFERESAGSSAGFRTHMLVALGSALFVLVPLQAGMRIEDLSRVLQGVVAGIGFLGAGAIIKQGQELEIRGLTTAASIWLTCAIGIAAGMGRETMAIVSTLFALIILLLVRVVSTPDHRGKDKTSR